MALTFGTLLSSQGADAHPSRSSDPSGGNFSTLAVPPEAVKPLGPAHTTATGSPVRGCGIALRGDRPDELSVPPLRALLYVTRSGPSEANQPPVAPVTPAGRALEGAAGRYRAAS